MNEYRFGAAADDEDIRIDVYTAALLEGRSRSFIQKLVKEGGVLVNSKEVKANYRLKEGDQILVRVPEAIALEITPEHIPLDIVYEDKQVILVNKPPGMVVHPAPGHYSGTLVNALLFHCGGNLSGINGVLRPGIVHRIDKDTSGILIAAKTDLAHHSLSAQFQEHSIRRLYTAIATGRLKETNITIDKPIGRNPKDRKKMGVTTGGKKAVTHITVEETFHQYSLIQARLETGRTHQIRVHMAYIGHPLLGDTVYGNTKQPFQLNGQALHAGLLGFVHPETGEYMEFRCSPPGYYQSLIQKIRATS